jgi:hypothetical protein
MSAAPKKGKLFAWLLIKGRIKVRTVLLQQKIVSDDSCPFGCNASETVEHFALNCDHTTQILTLLGIDLSGLTELSDIFDTARDRCVAQKKKAWDLVITASLWSIWLSRNRKVFDDLDVPIHVVAQQCLDTCKLWSHRATKDVKTAISFWFLDWAA